MFTPISGSPELDVTTPETVCWAQADRPRKAVRHSVSNAFLLIVLNFVDHNHEIGFQFGLMVQDTFHDLYVTCLGWIVQAQKGV
jgi:hypothetical protein